MRLLQLHSYSPPAAGMTVAIGIRVRTLTIGNSRTANRQNVRCGAPARTIWCRRAAKCLAQIAKVFDV